MRGNKVGYAAEVGGHVAILDRYWVATETASPWVEVLARDTSGRYHALRECDVAVYPPRREPSEVTLVDAMPQIRTRRVTERLSVAMDKTVTTRRGTNGHH